MKPVFSLPYLGNIEFYRTYLTVGSPLIDLGEHYIKQSYRNRAMILGANGTMPLIVPVLLKSGLKHAMSNTTISYETDWQRMHIEAIRSAYGSAPFFEYYFDEIAQIIRQNHPLLSDLSLAMHRQILELLDLDEPGTISLTYCDEADPDYRTALQPKNVHPFQCPRYTQVFSEKFPFADNLSIIDLLFCEGPLAAEILLA